MATTKQQAITNDPAVGRTVTTAPAQRASTVVAPIRTTNQSIQAPSAMAAVVDGQADPGVTRIISSLASPVRAGTTPTIEDTVKPTAFTIQAITNHATGDKGTIQFADGGEFASDKDFKYNPYNDVLQLNGGLETGNLTVFGSAFFSTTEQVFMPGGGEGQFLTSSGGHLTWAAPFTRPQLLTVLADSANNHNVIFFSGNVTTANLTTTGQVNLGNVANIHINGGNANQVLTTDGSGNLAWISQDKLRNELAGNNTQIQFNDNDVHGASANLTFNKTTNTLTTSNLVVQSSVANNITLGNATESVRNEFWFKATTNSTANSIILVMPSANVAGLDVTIVATEGTRARKISKILVATLGSVTNHSEYSTRYVGPNPGDFDVNQIGQNIALSVKPTTANTVVYNMIVTTYKD